MQSMRPAAPTELLELQTVRSLLLILGRHVIALFALGALQYNVVSRHLPVLPRR